MILAGFLIFSSLFMLLIAFFPLSGSIPFFFFGHFFSGLSAKLVLGVIGLVSGIAGLGIFKLKPLALDALLVVQAAFLVNGIAALISPGFLSVMQEAMQRADAENPAFGGGNPFLVGPVFHSILILGLCFGAAIIGLLLYYRSRFLEAAAAKI